jgi:hypothetical protein
MSLFDVIKHGDGHITAEECPIWVLRRWGTILLERIRQEEIKKYGIETGYDHEIESIEKLQSNEILFESIIIPLTIRLSVIMNTNSDECTSIGMEMLRTALEEYEGEE